MFIYTNHQLRKGDRKVNEMAHIRVPIYWKAGGQVRELVHISRRPELACCQAFFETQTATNSATDPAILILLGSMADPWKLFQFRTRPNTSSYSLKCAKEKISPRRHGNASVGYQDV
jgi:hypothetical protein